MSTQTTHCLKDGKCHSSGLQALERALSFKLAAW